MLLILFVILPITLIVWTYRLYLRGSVLFDPYTLIFFTVIQYIIWFLETLIALLEWDVDFLILDYLRGPKPEEPEDPENPKKRENAEDAERFAEYSKIKPSDKDYYQRLLEKPKFKILRGEDEDEIWNLSGISENSSKHIVVLYNFTKTSLVSIILGVLYFIYSIFFFKVQFLKQLAVWFIVGMLYFWLMSGFNFFLKRYKYGKFTAAIQRFWKRTNICFWLIEGFLMLLFFYYYLNSSQEPIYMYDFSSLNQEYLISGHIIISNVVLLSLVIYFMQFTLLRVNSNNLNQINLYIIFISVFIFSSFFLETYQFYYVLNGFCERVWSFDEDDNLWAVELDAPTSRTKHQYLMVCLIAKYWHFLFIFLSWVFFVMKTFERQKITYAQFGVNLQNIIILYVLNLVCYVQWIKWMYRRFFDMPYTWFFTSPEHKGLSTLLNECSILIVNLIAFDSFNQKNLQIVYKSLDLWQVNSLALWKFI